MADDERTKAGGRAPGKPARPAITIDLPSQRIDTGKPVVADAPEADRATPVAGAGAPTAGAADADLSSGTVDPDRTGPPETPTRSAATTPTPSAAAPPTPPRSSAGPSATPRAATSEAAARSKPIGAQPDAEAPASHRRARRGPEILALLVAGLAGAIIALALGYGLQAAGVLSAPGAEVAAEAQRRTVALASDIEALRGDMAALPPQPDLRPLTERIAALEALPDRLAGLEASLQDLADQLATLPAPGPTVDPQRIDRLQAALTALQQTVAAQGAAATPEDARRFAEALAGIESRIADLEQRPAAGVTAADLQAVAAGLDGLRSDLAAVQDRLGELGPAVDALQTAMADQRETGRAARALAIASLRAAAERGEPFAASLAMMRQLGIAEEQIAPLAEIAETGAPSRQQLADRFPAVADAILAATREVAPDAGFFDRLWGNARSLVTVRPAGPVDGATPAAIVSRMEAAAKAGDLAAALREREALPDAAKAASAEWATAAALRLRLDAAVADLDQAAARGQAGSAGP